MVFGAYHLKLDDWVPSPVRDSPLVPSKAPSPNKRGEGRSRGSPRRPGTSEARPELEVEVVARPKSEASEESLRQRVQEVTKKLVPGTGASVGREGLRPPRSRFDTCPALDGERFTF